jgi:hypothetical protein
MSLVKSQHIYMNHAEQGAVGLKSKSFLFSELLKLCESMYEICVCK